MFIVSERGRNYFDKSKDRGRYLSAGFHNLMGYIRDDQPLYELILPRKPLGARLPLRAPRICQSDSGEALWDADAK